MSPFAPPAPYDPSAWSVIAGFAAFFAAMFLLTCAWLATVRAFQTPAPTRPAAPSPRAGEGPTCSVGGCGKPATNTRRVGYENWPFCSRCREEYDALTGRAS